MNTVYVSVQVALKTEKDEKEVSEVLDAVVSKLGQEDGILGYVLASRRRDEFDTMFAAMTPIGKMAFDQATAEEEKDNGSPTIN